MKSHVVNAAAATPLCCEIGGIIVIGSLPFTPELGLFFDFIYFAAIRGHTRMLPWEGAGMLCCCSQWSGAIMRQDINPGLHIHSNIRLYNLRMSDNMPNSWLHLFDYKTLLTVHRSWRLCISTMCEFQAHWSSIRITATSNISRLRWGPRQYHSFASNFLERQWWHGLQCSQLLQKFSPLKCGITFLRNLSTIRTTVWNSPLRPLPNHNRPL